MKLIADITKLLESTSTMYQVRVASGDWQDVDLRVKSLEDIAKSVEENPHADRYGKTKDAFNVGLLTGLVEDWIGHGPDGRGSSWTLIEYEVQSLRDDVLKIKYYFGGFARNQEVGKSGIITIMPGV